MSKPEKLMLVLLLFNVGVLFHSVSVAGTVFAALSTVLCGAAFVIIEGKRDE